MTMLAEVVNAAKQVLHADRGSVWLYDPAADELVLEIATGIAPVRVPAGAGLVGACARDRRIINVPDCYADARFDPDVDRASGYRTRCMLTLPLIDHKDVLVGVMQVLNKAGGVFDADDEIARDGAGRAMRGRAAARADDRGADRRREDAPGARDGARRADEHAARRHADAARLRRLRHVPAGEPHRAATPSTSPLLDQGLLTVLGDATGHGIAPALSVTQMQAMLRMAFRLGADLETAFMQVNNQLAETLADDRFITAFIGLLDAATHRMRFHSGGQAPILHFQAATGACARYKPTSFPLGAMPLVGAAAGRQRSSCCRATSWCCCPTASTSIAIAAASSSARRASRPSLRAHHGKPMAELSSVLLASVEAFAQGAPQEDDITIVLVKRETRA